MTKKSSLSAKVLLIAFLFLVTSSLSTAKTYPLKREVAPKPQYTSLPSHMNTDKIVIKLKENGHDLHRKLQSTIVGAEIVYSSREFSSNGGSVLRVEIETQNSNISEIIRRIVMSGISVEAFGPNAFSLDKIFAKIVEKEL